jgi:hypothetical protein
MFAIQARLVGRNKATYSVDLTGEWVYPDGNRL